MCINSLRRIKHGIYMYMRDYTGARELGENTVAILIHISDLHFSHSFVVLYTCCALILGWKPDAPTGKLRSTGPLLLGG